MNRRDFVASVVPFAALGIVGPVINARSTDDFDYGSWRVCWSGWREPANQLVKFGVWAAWRHHRKPGDDLWYSTTLGVVSQVSEFGVMDLTYMGEPWPRPQTLSLAELAPVKQRAKDALLKTLRIEP